MRRQWEERTRAGDDDDERSGGERAMAMRRGACGHATTMRGEEESGQRRGGEERAAACGAVGREDLDTLHAPWLVVLSLVQNIHLKAINATSNPSSDAPRVALSEDLRGVLIHIHVSSSLDSKALARLTGIPVRTIQRILSNWKKTGEVKTVPTGKKGRPRALDFSDTQVRLRFLLVFKKLTPILPVSAVNGFAIQ